MPTINGTSANDVLEGTSGIDEINGLEGDDTINGVGGAGGFELSNWTQTGNAFSMQAQVDQYRQQDGRIFRLGRR